MKAKTSIALFGYHRTAVEVASYLRSGDYRLIIIDDDEDNLAKARYAGFETARLDFRNDSELKKLNLHKDIDVVFCLFPDDADNVFLTISIKGLAPDLRIFTIAHSALAVPKLIAAGASKVVDTHDITGRRISDMINRPMITDILDNTLFGQADLGIAEIRVCEASTLRGKRVNEIELGEHYNLILIGVVPHEGNAELIYAVDLHPHRIDTGDVLVVIGPHTEIKRLRKDLAEQAEQVNEPAAPSSDH